MADTILSVENLSSLKVADLKRELKERGLTISGNKTELIERLTAHLETESGSAAAEDLTIGDVSLSLNDSGGDHGDQAAKLDISADDSLLNDEKEVVLKPAAEKPVRQKITMSDAPAAKANGHVGEVKKVLTAEERLKMRSERFGVQSEDARKKARAERFGVTGSTTATSTKTSGKIVNTPVSADDLEKLKKRAERFGTVVSTSLSKATDIEKLKQRSERFGAVVAPSLSKVEEQERIRKRKERFGAVAGGASTKAALSSDEIEAKKRKRAERFGMS